MELKFRVFAHISKPVHEVFEAVADPARLSCYFTTCGAKGRLEEGATVSWDFHDWGASVTNRYISSLIETANGNSPLDSVSYWDLQVRWSPAQLAGGHLQLALGVNNITDVDTPGCFSCDVNNMDPTLYDLPGRFGYARIAYKH